MLELYPYIHIISDQQIRIFLENNQMNLNFVVNVRT